MRTRASTEPLVSVVLPTYNRVNYLREALSSALNQTYQNFELLVRDNASTEETRKVVQAFCDPRIRYHRHAENIGQTENVIGGFREASGEFVTNLHDDDVWEPTFLEKLVPPLQQNSGAGVAFSDHYIIDENGVIDPARTHRNTHLWRRHELRPGLHCPLHRIALLDKSVPLSMASVMRRSAIDWNDIPNLPACYDFWLLYLICRDGHAGYYVPERLARYRVHGGSQTARGRISSGQSFLMCFERMIHDERFAAIDEELRLEYARTAADLGITMVRRGEVEEGRPFLRRSIHTRCTFRGVALLALSYVPAILPGRRRAREQAAGDDAAFRMTRSKTSVEVT
jgi:glycosyltransferase involved in cell wall biosynthesis